MLKLALTLWLAAIALRDLRTSRIPNALTLPVMLGVGAFRLAQTLHALLPASIRPDLPAALAGPTLALARPAMVWLSWVVIFGLWAANVMRGGDAKLLMALFAIWPTPEFLFWFAVLVVALGLPALAWSHRRQSAGALVASATQRLLTGRVLPSAEDLQKHGRPYAWLFCVAGAIYLWLWA